MRRAGISKMGRRIVRQERRRIMRPLIQPWIDGRRARGVCTPQTRASMPDSDC